MGNGAGNPAYLPALPTCRWCGAMHVQMAGICWRVKKIEFYPDGVTPKSVELRDVTTEVVLGPVGSVVIGP